MKTNQMRTGILGVVVVLLLLAVVGTAYAVGERITRYNPGSAAGGGTVTNGQTTVRTAFGQPVVGVTSNANTTLCSGIACGMGVMSDDPITGLQASNDGPSVLGQPTTFSRVHHRRHRHCLHLGLRRRHDRLRRQPDPYLRGSRHLHCDGHREQRCRYPDRTDHRRGQPCGGRGAQLRVRAQGGDHPRRRPRHLGTDRRQPQRESRRRQRSPPGHPAVPGPATPSSSTSRATSPTTANCTAVLAAWG